jgi:hypothetical protein
LFDVVPMQWDWPVSVNFHESHAFANWRAHSTGRKVRVMSELEHNAIRDLTQRIGVGKEVVDPVMAYENDKCMADKVN